VDLSGLSGRRDHRRHVRCDACIDADPRQTTELRGRRGAAIAARKRALREWEKSHPQAGEDPAVFRREVLPGLRAVRVSEIVEAAVNGQPKTSRTVLSFFAGPCRTSP
jgi:hypothetical protein